jgi:two-component system response regulator FixJ
MTRDPIVYIIDDDDSARGSLEFLLDCAGLRVRGFASADAFQAASPSLDGACIVTDVRMPGTNGIELLDALRARGDDIPVVVMTGHADVPLAIRAMKLGAADFIEKPFDEDLILSAIRKAISDQRGTADARAEKQALRGRIAALSVREREVMAALVDGKANKTIAFELGISARTVEVYRANAMMKMRAKTLSDLVRMATIAQLGG